MHRCLTPEDLQQFAAGSLDQPARQRIEQHLRQCDACRKAQHDYSRNVAETIESPIVPRNGDLTLSVDSESSSPSVKVKQALPRIEGYQITGFLGQGGMGTVYRAVQEKLNRVVALKVLHAVMATASPSAVTRFRREASAAARLHHTNIVPIYDYGEARDGYFYAMELITGKPLDEFIASCRTNRTVEPDLAQLFDLVRGKSDGNGSAQPSVSQSGIMTGVSESGILITHSGRVRPYYGQVARWMADAASALDYAHREGIIHRDIKPANLILSSDGRIMIADFGLAKQAEDRTVTQTGSLMGTLRYMSPEQAMARRVRVDGRTDIYSLGASMYELLCFKPAYAGRDDKELLSEIISRDPTPTKKINHRVPAELDTICLKCMEKSQADRYQTGQELADDLLRYLNDLPIVARPPGAVRRAGKFVRRNRALVTVLTALVVVVCSVFVVLREREKRRVQEALRSKQEVVAAYENAMFLAGQKQWEPASKAFDRALDRSPRNIDLLLGAAWERLEFHKAAPGVAGADALELADALCQRVLKIDAENQTALTYRGVALRRLGRHEESIEPLLRAVQLAPERADYQTSLATAYVLSGNLGDAIRHLENGAKYAGSARDKYNAMVWRNLAVVELALGKPTAFKHIDQAIECDRYNALAWIVRAQIRLNLPQHTNPVDALDSAKHADYLNNERDGLAKRIRALAHLANDDWEAAGEHARLALQLGDRPAFDHLVVAVSEARLGRMREATEHIGAAKASWPTEFKKPGTILATAKTGDLWIETARSWNALKKETEDLIGAASSPRDTP